MRCHLYIHISYSTAHNLSYVFFMYYNPFSLQGEDGNTSFDALSSNILSTTSNSWSYKSALSLLSKNDNENCVGAQVERTNVASIIAAARSNLRHGRRNEDDDGDSGESDDDDDEKKRDVKEEEEGSDSSSGSSSSSSSSDSSDDSGSDDASSSEDEVDDADQATSMESDVLKVRERPVRKKDKMMKKKKATEEEEEASEKSHSEEEGRDKSSSSEDSESDNESGSDDEGEQEDEDEEELKEAAKAAAYFDNSSQHVTSESNSIDSFSQLGLSRPLLRGVASMGFVTPTLVQASVVPVALAGRDVCASAVTGSEFKFFLIRMVCMHQFFTYGLVVISISHVKWCTSSFFLSLHYSRW